MAAKQEAGWRCPKCGRRFRQRTREHSCDVRSLDAHLDRASAAVKDTVAAVQAALADIGPHAVVPVKTMILLRATANFGAMVVRRDCLNVEFMLARSVAHARIHKVQQVGPKKYAHHMRLESAADVDAQLKRWLREAYEIGAREPRPSASRPLTR